MALARNEGHNIFFVDPYLKRSNFIEEGYLQKNRIEVVGIHANTICYRDTMRMFLEIDHLRKRRLWSGRIVVGGPHTSVGIQTIPDFVDYVVQGEGEQAFLKILNGDAMGRVIREGRLRELDWLPFQPWDIFSQMPYDDTCPWMDIRPVFVMNTSRGCSFNCAFCSVGSIWGKKYTFFGAERIIDEIEYLTRNYGAKGIYFREDNFTLNMRRTEEFCEKMMQKNINLYWACETRVDNMSESLVKLMSSAGCRAVYLGIESGSQRILDRLNKKITVEQIEKTVNWFKKYDVRTYCSLIIGVPGETYNDYLLTKKLMRRLKPYAHAYSVFVGIPDSPLYKFVLEKGLYEYIDDTGLLYPPGYDVRAEYFYGKESEHFVDYEFEKRTSLDIRLLKRIKMRKIKRSITSLATTVLPHELATNIDKIRRRLQRI